MGDAAAPACGATVRFAAATVAVLFAAPLATALGFGVVAGVGRSVGAALTPASRATTGEPGSITEASACAGVGTKSTPVLDRATQPSARAPSSNAVAPPTIPPRRAGF